MVHFGINLAEEFVRYYYFLNRYKVISVICGDKTRELNISK